MVFFSGFTPPLWEIFEGNLLLLICSLFYLAWWFVSFKPNLSVKQNPSGGLAGILYLVATLITGVGGIALTSSGIMWLSQDSRGLSVRFILLGSAVVFFILLLVTAIVFHRTVTSELLIIHIWVALELSMVAVLHGTGHFGLGPAVTITGLVGIAFVVSLICYIRYYRLNGRSRYLDGMIPLIIDGIVMSVFLGFMATN